MNNYTLFQFRKLRLPLFFVLMAGTLVSCYKDKGNYEYKVLDPVTIDLTGLPTAYSRLPFDSLNIKPVVKYRGETVNADKPQFEELTFSWELYPAQVNAAFVEKHLLGIAPQLKTTIDQRILSWELLFTVTNKNTGVKTYAKFGVSVTTELAEGWMVLYERNGATDVGLIKNNEISKTDTKEQVFMDIYSASNGGPMRGTPGALIYSIANIAAPKLYVQSSEDVASVNLTSFQKIVNFDEGLFWSRPAVKAPQLIKATESRKEYLINNNKLHILDYTTIAPGDRAFYDALGGSYGQLAPWIAAVTAQAFDAVVYDQTRKCFLKVARNGAEVIPFTTVQNVTSAFDVRNTGMEFLMSDLGYNNWENIVAKDNEGKYFLLTANFREGETATIGKGKYDMSNCPEISSINSITAGYFGEVFYYSSSHSLYQFKYTPGTTERLWSAPGGEVITNISLQKYYNTNRGAAVLFDPKNLCKILYVATYNEATKDGKVYQLEVNTTSGALLPMPVKTYSGFGKIKAMAWKANIIR